MSNRPPAEHFPVSTYILEELVARNWSVAQFTAMMGYPRETIVALLYDEIRPDAEMCLALALLFGTDPGLWQNLVRATR